MAVGAGTAAGIALEGTWGTPQARTNWRPVVSSEVIYERGRFQPGRIGTGFFAGDVEGLITAGARTQIELTYENCGLWIQAALWSTVSTTGSGPYTHVYNQGTTAPVGYTVEEIHGDSGKSRLLEGGLVNTFEFALSVGTPYVSLTLEWIGEDVTEPSAGTASYGTGDEVVTLTDATSAKLDWNSNAYCCRSFRIRGSNALERRYCIGSGDTTEKPAQTGDRTVEVELELDYDANIDVEYRAGTEAAATLICSGSGNNQMTFLLRDFLIERVSRPINSQGHVVMRVTGRCRENLAGDKPLQITVINDNSSGTAN